MALELALTDLYTDANLKAYYRFSSGALTTDSSGEGHTLTAIGVPAEDTGEFDGGVTLGLHTDINYTILDLDADFTTYYWRSQPFTPTTNFITTISVQLKKVGSPTGNLTFELQTDNAGVPSGTVVYTTTHNVATLTTSYVDITKILGIPVTPGNQYHWVLKGLAAWDASNQIYWGYDTGSGFTRAYFGIGNFVASATSVRWTLVTTYNDFYTATDHADFKPTGNFSVGFWVKTTAATYQHPFTSWSVVSSKYYGMFVRVRSNGFLQGFSCLGTGVTDNTDFEIVEGTTTVADGNWHFGVFTWDGSYLRMYTDGVKEGEVAWTDAPVYNATNYVRIGSRSDTGSERDRVTGSLDDVFLINGTALTAAQISHIYNAIRGTKTSSSDALLYKRLTKTFVGDAKLWTQQTDTFNIDALLYKTNIKEVVADALLAKFIFKTFSVDALLFTIKTVTLSIDALLYRVSTDTFSVDAKLWRQDTKTFEVDARLWSQKVNTFAVDALLYEQSTKDVSLDANLAKANQILPFTLDARLYAVGTKPFSLDADLWKTLTLDLMSDALLVINKTKTFNSDALLYKTNSKGFLSDAILYGRLTSQFSLDARLYKIQTKTFNVDALLWGQKTKIVAIDAILYKTSITTIAVDAYLATNKIKVWNGVMWIEGSVKLWDGNAWVDKPFRYYDGSEWRFN